MAAPAIRVYAPVVPDPRKPVLLEANEPLVLATAFLEWTPVTAAGGVPARMAMTNRQMIVAFGRRCSLAKTPADTTYH